MSLDTSAIDTFAELTLRKRGLEAALKETEAYLRQAELAVLDTFADNQTSSVKNQHGTISLRTEVWARPKDGNMAALCERLKAEGFHDLVKEVVNIHTLSAWVREVGVIDIQPFEDVIDVEHGYRARLTVR